MIIDIAKDSRLWRIRWGLSNSGPKKHIGLCQSIFHRHIL